MESHGYRRKVDGKLYIERKDSWRAIYRGRKLDEELYRYRGDVDGEL